MPWMDIALQIPELVQSHELRIRINKVSWENKIKILYAYDMMVQW